jgi:hypothetical protein
LGQISTLNLVAVKHLIVVPRIRTSAYLSIFSDAFPALRNSVPSDIQEPALPFLKNLIVVDNDGEYKNEIEKADIHSAIDWREIMIWHDGTEGRAVRSMMKAVDKDDVINLQFTRCFSFTFSGKLTRF